MAAKLKSAAPGITVRFSAPIRDLVTRLARSEHRSAAAYIEQLVERDLREREQAERVVRVYTAAGLPDAPQGQVTREKDETTERHERRESVLNALFGAA